MKKTVQKETTPWLFSIVLISLLGIVVYSNSFYTSFHLDDDASIVHNLAIRNIQNLQDIWDYLPRRFLLYLSIALNYHFDGLNVLGYHLFNLIVHIASALLVWRLVLLTFSTPAMKEEKVIGHANLIALFVGLIFVAHPLQTEAVTYIVQRAASLATCLYLGSLCLYVRSRLMNEKKYNSLVDQNFYYIGSLIIAIAAMFTKEIAITLPLMILLYENTFLRSKQGLPWSRIIPFFLTIFIIPVIMLLTETGSARLQQLHSEPGISSMHYLLTQFRVVTTYVRLTFLPLNQNLDYDYSISKNILELPVLISLLFLMTLLFLAKRSYSKYRLVSFSLCWFFLCLLPESSVLPIQDVIFEHRLYLPMVGFSLFLVSGLFYLLENKALKWLVITLTIVTACYSVLTYQRNKIWSDEFTLWNDAAQKSPHKARPFNNLGVIFDAQNDPAHAVTDYNKALEIDPKFTESYINRGIFYEKKGDYSLALTDYNKAIELNPHLAAAYLNRGNALTKMNDLSGALSDYDNAVEINPSFTDAYYNRGIVYDKQGQLTAAIADFTKAVQIDPDYSKAYLDRGLVYFKEEDLPKAQMDYNKAIEINPLFAEAYNNRAILYYLQKKYDQAWVDLDKAQKFGFKVNPGFLKALERSSGRDM